jgi:hypothetical protein
MPMKNVLITLLLVSLGSFLLSGCAKRITERSASGNLVPSPTPFVSLIANHIPMLENAKKFSSKSLGIQFYYPSALFIAQRRNDPKISIVITNEKDYLPSNQAVNIMISSLSAPHDISLLDWIKNRTKYNMGGKEYSSLIRIEDIKINGFDGYIYEQGAEGLNLVAVLKKEQKVYEVVLIRHETGDSYKDNPQAIIYFYQILNTLKVI